MTFNMMAEQVLRLLASGDIPQDMEWDEGEIIAALGQVRDKLMMDWFGTIKQKSIPTSMYSVFRDVDVLEDTELNLKYSVLPAGFVNIPFDRAVPLISHMKNQEDNFKYLPQGGTGLFSSNRAGNLEGHVGFWNETGPNSEDRVYYKYIPSTYKKVLIKLPAISTEIDADDPIPLMEGWAWTMINEVYRLYATASGQPDDDKADNNDSTQ